MEASWPKTCGCGAWFSQHDWKLLKYVGIQRVPAELKMSDLELRNCSSCNSTMAVETTTPAIE